MPGQCRATYQFLSVHICILFILPPPILVVTALEPDSRTPPRAQRSASDCSPFLDDRRATGLRSVGRDVHLSCASGICNAVRSLTTREEYYLGFYNYFFFMQSNSRASPG